MRFFLQGLATRVSIRLAMLLGLVVALLPARITPAKSSRAGTFYPNWRQWRQTFEHRARRPEPIIEQRQLLNSAQQQQLARSLAIFQLGEGGEGRIAHQIDKAQIAKIDQDYRMALKLFVREEGRHARILGRCVKALGGESATANFSEKLFIWARRLVGVRFKLVVLLVAEVVSISCYRLIAKALPDSDVREALYELCADEVVHLQFHAEFFRSQTPTAAHRWVLVCLVYPITIAAAATVIFDHRHCWRSLDIAFAEVLRSSWSAARAALQLSGPAQSSVMTVVKSGLELNR